MFYWLVDFIRGILNGVSEFYTMAQSPLRDVVGENYALRVALDTIGLSYYLQYSLIQIMSVGLFGLVVAMLVIHLIKLII